MASINCKLWAFWRCFRQEVTFVILSPNLLITKFALLISKLWTGNIWKLGMCSQNFLTSKTINPFSFDDTLFMNSAVPTFTSLWIILLVFSPSSENAFVTNLLHAIWAWATFSTVITKIPWRATPEKLVFLQPIAKSVCCRQSLKFHIAKFKLAKNTELCLIN